MIDLSNVVVIVADTFRRDHLGTYGNPFIRTPHLECPPYYTTSYREGYAGEQIYPRYGNWKEAGLSKDDVNLGYATYCGEVTMVDFWVGGSWRSWTPEPFRTCR